MCDDSCMMTLDETGNYNPWIQPKYGFNATDCKVKPPHGYHIIPRGEQLRHGDIPFDVYGGWFAPIKRPSRPTQCRYPDLQYNRTARSGGRWTTWARPIDLNNGRTE